MSDFFENFVNLWHESSRKELERIDKSETLSTTEKMRKYESLRKKMNTAVNKARKEYDENPQKFKDEFISGMIDSLQRDKSKLELKALRTTANSPKQLDVRKEITALNQQIAAYRLLLNSTYGSFGVKNTTPTISEVEQNGELENEFMVDESQSVSNAGSRSIYNYKGTMYSIITWNNNASEHEPGSKEIKAWGETETIS